MPSKASQTVVAAARALGSTAAAAATTASASAVAASSAAAAAATLAATAASARAWASAAVPLGPADCGNRASPQRALRSSSRAAAASAAAAASSAAASAASAVSSAADAAALAAAAPRAALLATSSASGPELLQRKTVDAGAASTCRQCSSQPTGSAVPYPTTRPKGHWARKPVASSTNRCKRGCEQMTPDFLRLTLAPSPCSRSSKPQVASAHTARP